jgi:hypothetical protein
MEHPNQSDPFSVGGELHTALKAGVAEIALMPEGAQGAWALRGVASMLIETWRKMWGIVGHAMVTLQGQVPDLPLGVYMQRIEALVRDARLEAQGDIRFIRLSEVRLPSTDTRAAAQATRAE